MQFRTPLNSVSHSGYSVDVLKSAFQKYLRRREEEKMVWCMEELYLFGVLGENEKENRVGKAIVSNLMNRIIEDTKEIGKVEVKPKFEGRQMIMIIHPN